MSSEFASQLREISSRLEPRGLKGEAPDVREPLQRLEDRAVEFSKAWSGSNFGFHSCIYHANFTSPAPGEHFSSEWGFNGVFQGTTGDWKEYARDDVLRLIRDQAGDPDLDAINVLSTEALADLENSRRDVVSILAAFLAQRSDEFLNSIKSETEGLIVLTKEQAIRAQLPSGQRMSRDAVAISQGLLPAPHQELLAEVVALRTPFMGCLELARLADSAAAHIDRLTLSVSNSTRVQGSNVFLGHGRSLLWRELKDFVQDRLTLPWDEFNRIPVAGTTNIARLVQMLDDAGIAFLILTAEDEKVDGGVVARQNVVHEAGLFQGRLGFTRAILLIEDGCSEFSNIQGLGQIRFPAGNIGAAFEEIRRVLEREGFIDA
jgi:predicted nucleotide-binding protein